MKIAYIALRGVPLSDGIAQYTDDIAKELVKRGHEVTVYTSRRYGNVTGIYNNSYNIITVPSLPWGFAEKMSIVFFASIKQLFKKYDIVHYHAMGPSFFAFMSRGKGTIIQSHGIEYNRSNYGKKAKKALMILEKMSIKMGDEILVCSNMLHNHFFDKYNKETIVIHNSVNIPINLDPDKNVLNKYELEKNSYYLFMARISQEKGLEYLIRSYKKLKTSKKLIIAGPFNEKNPYHLLLKEMSSNDLRIKFIGFASGEIKRSLIAGAYAFVLPSESEGFSIALLEAMSYAKCCIVSNIPSIIEAVADCGMIFETKKEESLYNALEKAEKNPDQVLKFGCYSRERVIKYFSEKTMVEKVEKLYSEVLERKKYKRIRRKNNEETKRIQTTVDNI